MPIKSTLKPAKKSKPVKYIRKSDYYHLLSRYLEGTIGRRIEFNFIQNYISGSRRPAADVKAALPEAIKQANRDLKKNNIIVADGRRYMFRSVVDDRLQKLITASGI